MAEYPYPMFKHGAYGEIVANGVKLANNGESPQALVVFGTAPVGQVEGGAQNVNVPIVCTNISEARKYLGYSDDWDKYTLCEVMHVLFEQKGVGPAIFINVLNPTTHKNGTAATASLTPKNGKVTIASAADIILDTIVVKSGSGQDEVTYVKGTDYTVKFDYNKMAVIIAEIEAGGLGSSALTITYNKMDATAVTSTDIIGTTDGYGLNTGLYTIENVYNLTGYIPAYMAAPGWSSLPAVHTVMAQESEQIGSHWNAWMFVDMPLTSNNTAITLASAPTWKNTNSYTKDNESVFFPMAKGTDGKKYHLSVLVIANFLELLNGNDGVPYMSASNTEAGIIQDLYFGEGAGVAGRVCNDAVINKTLCANGINSAAYVSGRWVIWGTYAGSYDQDNATSVNVFDTCRMMLNYVTNDFQHRRNNEVDQPMSINELKSIVAEEQSIIDALLAVNALSYGVVKIDVSMEAKSDMVGGDWRFLFNVTNTPLRKSLTAVVVWTADGFQMLYTAIENM